MSISRTIFAEASVRIQGSWFRFLNQFDTDEKVSLKPLKITAIGLISSVITTTDKFFELLKIHVRSIYFSFLDIASLFHLWILQVLTTLPKYRALMMQLVGYYIPSPSSVLVNGMVFGDDTGMPPSLNHSVKIIGMQHVLAASGFNVGLILTLIRPAVSRFCPPLVTGFFCLMGIGVYVALIGAPASAVRAGLMVGYTLIASIFIRRQSIAWYSLLVSAAMMLLVSWEYLESISFQLSVTATLGLILVEPRLTATQQNTWFATLDGVKNSQPPQTPKITAIFKDTAITTIAAQAFTLPLLFYHFGELSTLSLAANVMLLWLTPLITVSGITLVLLAVLTQVLTPLGIITYLWSLGVKLLSECFIYLVSWLGQAEWSFLELPFVFPFWAVLLWWGLLCIWIFFGKNYVQNA